MSKRNRDKRQIKKGGLVDLPKREVTLLEPVVCFGCGLKTEEWYSEHPDLEEHWLLIPIVQPGNGRPFPGIAMYGCPRCGQLSINANAKENNKQIRAWIKEDEDRKIAVASGLVDPAGRPLDLRSQG